METDDVQVTLGNRHTRKTQQKKQFQEWKQSTGSLVFRACDHQVDRSQELNPLCFNGRSYWIQLSVDVQKKMPGCRSRIQQKLALGAGCQMDSEHHATKIKDSLLCKNGGVHKAPLWATSVYTRTEGFQVFSPVSQSIVNSSVHRNCRKKEQLMASHYANMAKILQRLAVSIQ